MLNEGYKASSPGMVIGDVRFKGGMYVELTQTNQHVENIYVDTIASENYEAFCDMAYDVPARSNTSTELVINPGTCSAIPGKQDSCLPISCLPVAHMVDAKCSVFVYTVIADHVSSQPASFVVEGGVESFCCLEKALALTRQRLDVFVEARPYQKALILSEEAHIILGNGTAAPPPAVATAG